MCENVCVGALVGLNSDVDCCIVGAHDTETMRVPDMHHGMEVRVGLSKGPVHPSFM